MTDILQRDVPLGFCRVLGFSGKPLIVWDSNPYPSDQPEGEMLNGKETSQTSIRPHLDEWIEKNRDKCLLFIVESDVAEEYEEWHRRVYHCPP